MCVGDKRGIKHAMSRRCLPSSERSSRTPRRPLAMADWRCIQSRVSMTGMGWDGIGRKGKGREGKKGELFVRVQCRENLLCLLTVWQH